MDYHRVIDFVCTINIGIRICNMLIEKKLWIYIGCSNIEIIMILNLSEMDLFLIKLLHLQVSYESILIIVYHRLEKRMQFNIVAFSSFLGLLFIHIFFHNLEHVQLVKLIDDKNIIR